MIKQEKKIYIELIIRNFSISENYKGKKNQSKKFFYYKKS